MYVNIQLLNTVHLKSTKRLMLFCVEVGEVKELPVGYLKDLHFLEWHQSFKI